MAENNITITQPLQPVETQSSKYDVEVPIQPLVKEDEPFMPNKAASEDSLMAAMIEYGSPIAEHVQAIQHEYEQRGASTIIEDIRMRGAEQRNQEVIGSGLDAVVRGDIEPASLAQVLEATPAVDPDDVLDLHQEYFRSRLFRDSAKSAEQKAIAEQKIAFLVSQGYPVDIAIQDRMDWILSGMDDSAATLTGGILADIAPFATSVAFNNAFRTVFPEDDPEVTLPFFLNKARGEMAVEIRTRMEKLSPEERYSVAANFMDALENEKGGMTGQDFQRLMILQEALGPEFSTTDRVIGDAITVLDSVGLGQIVKGLWKLGKSMFLPGSPVSTVNLVDPESAAALASQGIKTDMKASLGMDQIDMIEVAAGVKNLGADIELLPPDIARMLDAGNVEKLDLINRTRGNPLVLKEHEKSALAKEIRGQLQETAQAGHYGSNFTAEKLEDGLAFRARFGVRDSKGMTQPFTTALDAMTAAKHRFPTATNVRIFRKKPNGQTVEAKAINRRAGEYIYEIEGFQSWAQTMNRSDKMFGFKEGDIIRTGADSKWRLDPASRFAKWMSSAFGQAGDQGRGINKQLGKIAKPFADLKIGQQRKAVHLLDKYAKNSDNMTTADIIQAAEGDAGVLRGFYAYRQTMDTLWHLENRAFREDLIVQGAKHLVADDFAGMGIKQSDDALSRAVGRGKDKKVEVYDPIKGTMVQLDQAEMTKLLADGKSIYKVREPVGELAHQSDLVLISKADQVRELPGAVLKKIDGYIPRHYKETYWVRRIIDGTKNGAAHQNFQILRAVGDKAEANQVVRELVADGTLTVEEAKRAITHDRAINPKERATIEQQDQISLGRMFYHKRADQRVRGIDGFAEISDPVEAMMKNMHSTARFVGNDQLLSTMKKRWMDTFARQLGLVDRNKPFPQSRDEIGGAISGTPTEKAQALESWDHIRATESITTREGEIWRDGWIKLIDGIIRDSTADSLAGMGKKVVTAPMKLLRDKSPNSVLRSIGFYHLIAGAPVRQLYVQAQQWMFIAALAPLQAPKIVVQNKAVMLGLMRDAFPEIYKAQKGASAKVMGMSTKEYDHFIDQFMKTGIPHSVDSHDYVTDAFVAASKNISGNAAQRAARKGWNGLLAPLNIAKKVGFDLGELSNLTNSFLMARIRFLKANPGKKELVTPADFQKVAADARQLALDMTRSGAFRYQDGALSAATQFLSIQHKALNAIIPLERNPFTGSLVGNQAFSVAERRKMALGQFLLHGVTGLGLYEMYKGVQNHIGERVPPEYEKFIVGGMYEYIMNKTLGILTGEEEDLSLNIAGAVAPASGINQKLGDVYEILLSNEPITDIFPSMNVVNRYTELARTANAMHKYPTLNNDEDIQTLISSIASTTSGWNNFIKGRAAMRLGWHVSTSGSPTVQASFGSAIMQGTLGLQQRTLEEFYALQNEYANKMQKENHLFPDADSETTQVAQALYNTMTRTVSLFQDEFNPDVAALPTDVLTKLHQQRMVEALEMHARIKGLYTPIENDRIWQKFSELAKVDRTRHSDGLIDTILKMFVTGDLTGEDELKGVVARIRASGIVERGSDKDMEMQFVVENLFKSLHGREELSNFNNEQIQEHYNGGN